MDLNFLFKRIVHAVYDLNKISLKWPPRFRGSISGCIARVKRQMFASRSSKVLSLLV